jgi:hypothetical protein
VHAYRSAWIWGAVIPLAIVVLAILIGPVALLWLFLYPLQVLRIAVKSSGPWGQRMTRALFLVLGKFPEAAGQIKFLWGRRSGATARIIEYK